VDLEVGALMVTGDGSQKGALSQGYTNEGLMWEIRRY